MKNLLRKTFIINPRLQYFIPAFFGLTALCNLIFFILLHSIVKTKVLEDAKLLDPESQQFLIEYLKGLMESFAWHVIIFNIFVFLLTYGLGAIMLNNIAGPVYAIKRRLDELAAGVVPPAPLNLRKTDFFKDVAASVNRVADKIEAEKKDH